MGVLSTLPRRATRPDLDVVDFMLVFALGAVVVTVALLMVQSIYIKKSPQFSSFFATTGVSTVFGLVAGAIYFVGLYGPSGSHPFRGLAFPVFFGFVGAGFGLVVTMFLPNFKRALAFVTGLIVGADAGIIPASSSVSNEETAAGFALFGLAAICGFVFSIVEELGREAWIQVYFGPSRSVRSVGLGREPIIFGSDPKAHIVMDRYAYPPIVATVQLENGQVFVQYAQDGTRQYLQSGQRVDFGAVGCVVYLGAR